MAAESMKRDRMVSYLAGLSPAARDMLLRKLERDGAGGDQDARTVLEAARHLVRPPAATVIDEKARPAAPTAAGQRPAFDPRERFFAPFAAFLIDETIAHRQPGWLRRKSLDALWTFLEREVLTEALAPWTASSVAVAHASDAEFDAAVRAMRSAAFGEIQKRIAETGSDPRAARRLAMHLGGDEVYADALDMIQLRERLPFLDRLTARLPATVGSTDVAERLAADTILPHLVNRPDDAAYVAAVVARRVASPASLFKLVVHLCGSDDVADVRGTAAEAFIEAALAYAERMVARFDAEQRSNADVTDLAQSLRKFHDVVRGGTTVVVLNDDAEWRGRLAELRRTMSHHVARAIEDALPTLRRALRIEPGMRPNVADAAEAARVVAIFTAARRHRDALAINDLVTRLGTSVEQAIDVYGRELIEQLRRARGDLRTDLSAVSEHLLKMAEMTHGEAFAGLMRKSRDLALGRTG